MIYLDNAATTKIDPQVLDAMMPYLTEQYGNAGTLYGLGRQAKEAIEEARKSVAKLIGSEPEQIVFTSGGTEGNNMVFSMMSKYLKQHDKKGIVTSSIEHDSVLKAAQSLADDQNFEVTRLPVDHHGDISLDYLRYKLAQNTGFVSVMYVNNEISVMNPVELIARMAHKAGALFHTDCVQALACRPINVKKINCDFATISSHKIHGPKGVGAVYIKDKALFSPMIFGGSAQEFGMRGGTENVAGIVGFGKACELLSNTDRIEEAAYIENLKSSFSKGLFEELEEAGLEKSVKLNGGFSLYGTKSLNFRIDGVDAESLILMLDPAGVCISAGSACNSREQVPSHVLKAIGLSDDAARSSFRVSFSKMNTISEVEIAGRVIGECIITLKG